MHSRFPAQAKANGLQTTIVSRKPSGRVKRKCACGGNAGLTAECDECQRKHLAGERLSSVQPKLTISQPGDKYEQEADRIADTVMRIPDQSVQRQADPNREEEELLQTKPAAHSVILQGYGDSSEVPTGVQEASSAPGKALDRATRAFMEPRFGHDFSKVRVHDGTKAAESAQSVNALAYTVGNHVVFGEGQYAPYSSAGRRLLAHELTHVVQQVQPPGGEEAADRQLARSSMPGKLGISHRDPYVARQGDESCRDEDSVEERILCELLRKDEYADSNDWIAELRFLFNSVPDSRAEEIYKRLKGLPPAARDDTFGVVFRKQMNGFPRRKREFLGILRRKFSAAAAGQKPTLTLRDDKYTDGSTAADGKTPSRKDIKFEVFVPAGLISTDYVIVQWMKGCSMARYINKPNDNPHSNEHFGSTVDFDFPDWVLDGKDKDPVYGSRSGNRWNYTETATGFTSRDSPGQKRSRDSPGQKRYSSR